MLSITTQKGIYCLLFTFLLSLLTASPSNGQLAAWQLNGAAGNEVTKNATTVAANISTPALSRSGGINASALGNAFSATNFPAGGTQENAATNGRGFTLSFSANFGYKVSLSNLNYRLRRSSTGPNAVIWQYSINGGGFTNIGTSVSYTLTTSNGDAQTPINLSSIAALQNVLYGNTITLRLICWGASATGGTIAIGRSVTNGATDFSLSIDGAVVSAGPTPVISTTGSLSTLSTVYGTASAYTSFDVSGTDMTTGITVSAPTGYEVSDNSSSGYSTSITIGSAGTIANTTIYARLKAEATVALSPYGGNIACTSIGAVSVNVPTQASIVLPYAITAVGAIAQNKIYDGSTNCVITGSSPSAMVNNDVITLTGGGNFNDKHIGIAKPVTGALTVSGTNASSYILTQPMLNADINALALTISGAQAQNKIYDGTDSAIITGALTGVISPDLVGFNGIGQFASALPGTAIPVTALCTLNGPDWGNYTLTQPTGLVADITPPGLSPQTIYFTLTSPVTYGDVPITLNGFATSALPVSYVSSNPSVASVLNDVLTIHSDGIVVITASQPGDNILFQPAPDVSQTLIINKKEITIVNLSGNSKVYDHTNSATFNGLLDGVVSGDNVMLNATGTFPQISIGTNLTITSTATISGPDSSKYTLIQPVGLLGDIIPKTLTIQNAQAKNKIYDGSNTATITGTLMGTVSPDVLTLTLSGTFASSNIGNGIMVTSTSTVSGTAVSNYILQQPSGLMANIYPIPTLTEDILPQYIQGMNSSNTTRVPYAYRVSIHNLIPNATYRYYNTVVVASDAANSNGAGNILLVNPSGFTRVTTPSLSTAGSHATFVSDSNGNYTGWFATEPSANATRFTPGFNVYMRIMLNDGEGGTSVASRVTTTNFVKVINFSTSAGVNNGSGLRGNSNALAKNFVIAYDNIAGTGRPISATFVESDGTLNNTSNSYVAFYANNVEAVNGAYGMIIPNNNPSGIQRLEQRALSNASLVGCATAPSGMWPGGANTVNPIGGTSALALSVMDADLSNCGVTLNLKCFIQGYYVSNSLMTPVLMNQLVSGALSTESDDVIVELHDTTTPYTLAYTFTGKLLTNGTIACSYPSGASGNSYYVVVKNRTTLETWSANPVAITSTINYDFSTAGSMAYGNNQVEVETGIWALISGDINQDLAVDAFDYLIMDPDIMNGSSGYLSTDLNGDGSVDAFDYLVFDPNSNAGYTIQAP